MRGIEILSVIVLALLICGCNDCRNDDCPANAKFQFKVVDSEGKSLFERTKFAQPVESNEIRIIGKDNSGNEEEVRLWQDDTTLWFVLI